MVKRLDPSLFVKAATFETEEVYRPKNNFWDLKIDKQLKTNISYRGYKEMTPIQDEAILPLLSGRDLVGIASTGTGKTAAFLIPLINKVTKDRSQKVLIIAPTRELAVQIEAELKSFAKNMGIYSVLCIGGLSMGPQISLLLRRPNFVIGTPGRLRDLEGQKKLNFGDYKTIVLDEVDRMLDMGFIADVTYIINKLAKIRQSLFFSATMPEKVAQITLGFLQNPVMVRVKTVCASANVNQDVIKLAGQPKLEVLERLLRKEGFNKVLVFGRTKHGVNKLSRDLKMKGFITAEIHGNKTQAQRQRAIGQFKNDQVKVLLATDVASRGLDINNITHVINYDQPESYEDYIHRIGRTGRAGKSGTALTFID